MTDGGGGTATLRLFFALWPGEDVRDQLRHSTRKAVRASGGRPVDVRNLHVTLAFLGSVPCADRERVEAAAGEVVLESFVVPLTELKYWPRTRVLVLAPTGASEPLSALHSTLWDRLEAIGFAREHRPFRPHVTLARKVASPGPLVLRAPIEWRVETFALVRSVTDPAGARYQVLREWSLSAASADEPAQ